MTNRLNNRHIHYDEGTDQRSNRILINRSAAGETEVELRFTSPIERSIFWPFSGLEVSTDTLLNGIANLGTIDIPSPISTKPSDVERCCTS